MGSSDGKIVKLEFALGDFDDTPIAALEEVASIAGAQEEESDSQSAHDDSERIEVLKTGK